LGGERFVPSPTPAGTVVDQDPGAGSQVNVGTQVSIVIAKHG
jgi:beta-lactam-binding protein with PASTA domain